MQGRVWRQHAWWILALAASAGMLGGGCSDDDKLPIVVQQQRVWAGLDIHDYRYQLRQGCFCPSDVTMPVEITVTGDTIAAVRDVRADTLLSVGYWRNFKTIDDLFDLAILASQEADHFEVDFDDQYGYPARIDIYWDNHVTDAGYLAEAGGLERL